jgi:hypothetical protein
MGYWTLATFLAARLERALWTSYCESLHVDPRLQKTTVMRYNFRGRVGLRTKTHLATHWARLGAPQRLAIVGRLGDMLESVLSAARQRESVFARRLALLSSLVSLADDGRRGIDELDVGDAVIAPITSSSTSSSSSTTTTTSTASTTLVRTAVRRSSVDALEAPVSARASSPRLASTADSVLSHTQVSAACALHCVHLHLLQFVESLFFTPLVRANSPRDLVLRRIGQRLQVTYVEQRQLGLRPNGSVGSTATASAAGVATSATRSGTYARSSSQSAATSTSTAASSTASSRATKARAKKRDKASVVVPTASKLVLRPITPPLPAAAAAAAAAVAAAAAAAAASTAIASAMTTTLTTAVSTSTNAVVPAVPSPTRQTSTSRRSVSETDNVAPAIGLSIVTVAPVAADSSGDGGALEAAIRELEQSTDVTIVSAIGALPASASVAHSAATTNTLVRRRSRSLSRAKSSSSASRSAASADDDAAWSVVVGRARRGVPTTASATSAHTAAAAGAASAIADSAKRGERRRSFDGTAMRSGIVGTAGQQQAVHKQVRVRCARVCVCVCVCVFD